MFLDLSGFSTMTDALMQHGQHGAEVLAALMHGVFDPLVESIFDYGGEIGGFTGGGDTGLYPTEGERKTTDPRALASACVVQQRLEQSPTRETVYGTFPIRPVSTSTQVITASSSSNNNGTVMGVMIGIIGLALLGGGLFTWLGSSRK